MKQPAIILYLILGILLCMYGVAVRMVGSGTSFYLIWFAGGILCFLHAIAAKTGIWEKIPKALRRTSFAMFGACLLIFLFVESLILSAFHQHGEEDLDYIIALGAQVYDSGPSIVLKYRLDAAAEYLKDNPSTVCIVSGGQGYNEPHTEARIMRDYLVAHGISGQQILMEDKALNTVQNIRYSVDLLNEQSIDLRKRKVGIVTNNFHVFRGVSIAKKQGFEQVCGISAGSHPYYLPNNMLREFCGVCKDKLFGNL